MNNHSASIPVRPSPTHLRLHGRQSYLLVGHRRMATSPRPPGRGHVTDDIGIRRWGSGNRDAVLIHGLGNSSESWWEIGPALAERGYAVHAVDLPGHGDSIALPSYSVEEMVSAVVAAVPEAPALAIGHSLGGLVLAHAVSTLLPGLAVYEDPAWTLSLDPRVFDSFRAQKQWAISDLERNHPRWSDGSRARKLAALARWDTAILDDLPDFTPAPIGAPEVPSAVILADPSALVPVERAKQLRELGYTVQSVEGAGHVVHFDDFSGYLRALDEVIDR